jgi:hypothetical protein
MEALKTIGLVIAYAIFVILTSVAAIVALAGLTLAAFSPIILIVWLILEAGK